MPDVIFQERALEFGFHSVPTLKSINPVEKRLPLQLYKNKEGIYEVFLTHLTPNQHHQFFDGDVCVLDVFKTSDSMELQVNTEKQLNITGDISLAEVIQVKSTGPVAFQSPITCNCIDITTSAVCFSDAVNTKQASINCTDGVAILKEFIADVLECNADSVYQADKLNIKDQLTINAITYEQAESAITHVEKNCCMLADSLYLDGNFSVNKKALFISDRIIIGQGKSTERKQSIHFPADTYLRAQYSLLEQNSRLITATDHNKKPNIKIDFFELQSGADCKLENINYEGDVIRNNGDLNIANSEMAVNRLTQLGQANINYSNIAVSGLFDANEATTITKSQVSSEQFNAQDTTLLDDCLLETDTLMVTTGKLNAINQTEIRAKNSLVQKDSMFDMEKSILVTEQQFLSYGQCHFDQVDRFEAEFANFYGPLTGKNCYFTPHVLEFNTDELKLTACQGSTHALKFGSKATPGLINQSEFSTQFLLQKGKLRLENHSGIFSVEDDNSCFLVEGDLDLAQSTLITKGNVYFRDRSKINQLQGMIQAKHVYSTAEMTAAQSLLFSKTFNQKNASLSIDQTRFYVETDFSSQQSRISAKDSQITAKNLTHQGELTLDHAKLQSEYQIIQADNFRSTAISVTPKSTILRNSTIARGVQLAADEIQLYNDFNIENSSLVAKKYISLRPEAIGTLKKSIMKARDIDSFATITLTDTQLEAEHHIIMRPVSDTTIKGTVSLKSENHIYLQGKIHQPAVDVAEENQEQKPALFSAIMVSAKNELDIASTAQIHVNQIAIEADTTKNRGVVKADDSFELKGKTFYNQNTVSADISALHLDHGFVNLGGDFSAKNITINANTFNIFGGIYAKENYTQNGLFSLNMGILSGSNVYSSNLISFNAGLILPNFSADPKFWFSSNNLYMMARTTLGFVLPQFSHTTNLLFAIPSLIGGVQGLYQLSKKYDSWDKIKNMHFYEIMPALCQIKSAVTMTIGASRHGASLGSEFKSLGSGFKDAFHDLNWSQLGKDSLGIFGGHYVDDSLLSVNTGGTFSQSTAKTNLFDFNSGISASLQNHSVTSYWIGNSGFSGGDQSSFSAYHGNNSGMLYGRSSMRLDFDDLRNDRSGMIYGSHLSGHIGTFSQEGEIDWDKGAITIDHFMETNSAKDSLQNISIAGETASFAGMMRAKGVYFDYNNSVEFEETAHAELDNTRFKTGHFSTRGNLSYQNHLVIDANKTDFLAGSQTAGAVSDKPKPEPTTNAEGDNKTPSSSDSVNVLLVSSEDVLINGKLSGGDYTQISGKPDEATAKNDSGVTEVPKCNSIVIGEDADIKLTRGAISGIRADISGQTNLNEFNLQFDSAKINQHTTVSLENSAYKGKDLTSDGALKLNNASVDCEDSIKFGKTADNQLSNTQLKTATFATEGTTSYQNYVSINAKETDFLAGSQTTGAVSDKSKPEPTTNAEGDNKTPDPAAPANVLLVGSEKVLINGKLSGGDYTQISGKSAEAEATSNDSIKKCDSLVIGKDADIDLTHGVMASTKADISGQTKLNEFNLQLDSTKINQHTTVLLENSAYKGKDLTSDGTLKSNNVSVDCEDSIKFGKTADNQLNNTQFKTTAFTTEGTIAYQNYVSINAKETDFLAGSQTTGAVSDKPKPAPTPIVDGENKTLDLIDPTHVLLVNSDNVLIDGKVSGGDYTQISGKPNETTAKNSDGVTEITKCNSIVIGEHADIDLTCGAIAATKADISGQTNLSEFNIQLDSAKLNQNSKLSLDKSAYKGNDLKSDGILNLNNDLLNIDQIELSNVAQETINDTTINAKKVRDSSQLNYQGQTAFITDQYEHGGRIHALIPPSDVENKNIFYVKSNSVDLHGGGDLDQAYYDIQHLTDAKQFISGTGNYSNYNISNSLMFETGDSIYLDNISRNCNLTVKAADITMAANYNKARDLTFISTVGDVSLLSNITANNLYVQSAHDIWTNHTINTTELISFDAKGGYYNLAGTLNGDTVAIKASEIKNISAGSSMAQQSWSKSMGNTGIINGRTNTYLEATIGNIENYGGIIRAGEYTQLVAKGNVLNACNVRTFNGAYDVIQEFDPGLISGGNGTKTEGIGLYIKADGQIISDASDFVSNGINYLEADKGFDFKARQHTYVSDRWTTKKWYGKKETHTQTSTTVKGTIVHSGSGCNILRTEHGGMNSVATQFSSPGGTEIYSRDDVKLYSLKSKDYVYNSKSTLWGLSKHSTKETHESATPTLFVDNGVTRITSTEGSVDARGAYFVGAGDLFIKAKNRIKFGVDILDHDIVDKSRTLSISVPGMAAYDAWRHGGNLMDIATAEDATLAKLNSLMHSENTTEFVANSTNLGINLYNTTNSAMRGIANDTLDKELLSRYGFGGANGFSPAITLSMTESKTTTKYQTVSQGGVDRGGNVSLEAGEGIDLENGVRVHAGGNMDVNAPEIIAKAAELQSSVDQKTTTQSVSFSITGQPQDASVGYSKTHTQSTNYLNAELSAGGNMKLHNQDGAMALVELDGANIKSQTLDADINKLIITDKQDKTSNTVESASISASGQVSAYKGQGDSKITNQKSGLHVTDGINTNGHSVHVGEAKMTGGEITTDGQNNIQIDRLEAHQLQDEQHYSGIGISFNVNDVSRLTGGKATNEVGEQTIAIAEINVDRINYLAERAPVIFGAQGTTADIKELIGNVHTSSADGAHVIRDDKLHLVLDVPITNGDYLAKSRENIQAGANKISEHLGLNKKLDESVLPSRKEEERFDSIEEKEEDAEEEEFYECEELDDDKFYDAEDSKTVKEKDLDVSPEVLQEVFDKALTDLKFDSPKDKKKFEDSIAAAKKEYDETREVSKSTLNKINENIKSAVLQTLKAGSEEGWGQLTKALGHEYNKKLADLLSSPDGLSKLSIKSYMGSKGILYTFAFNLALASVDSTVDHDHLIKEGVTHTVADLTFGVLLRYSVGGAAGPVGWGLVGLGIIDTLFYDEKAVNKLCENGIANLQDSQQLYREGHYFAGFGLQQMAADQMRAASQAQAWHQIATITDTIASAIGYAWDKMTKPTPPPVPPSSIPTWNSSRMFQPANENSTNSNAVSNVPGHSQ